MKQAVKKILAVLVALALIGAAAVPALVEGVGGGDAIIIEPAEAFVEEIEMELGGEDGIDLPAGDGEADPPEEETILWEPEAEEISGDASDAEIVPYVFYAVLDGVQTVYAYDAEKKAYGTAPDDILYYVTNYNGQVQKPDVKVLAVPVVGGAPDFTRAVAIPDSGDTAYTWWWASDGTEGGNQAANYPDAQWKSDEQIVIAETASSVSQAQRYPVNVGNEYTQSNEGAEAASVLPGIPQRYQTTSYPGYTLNVYFWNPTAVAALYTPVYGLRVVAEATDVNTVKIGNTIYKTDEQGRIFYSNLYIVQPQPLYIKKAH